MCHVLHMPHPEMKNLNLPDRPILLDGGMGRELRSRGVNILTAIWSANGLIKAPDTVRQIHQDYISAGADIIITNTYGIIRSTLAQEGLEDQFEARQFFEDGLTRPSCPALPGKSILPTAKTETKSDSDDHQGVTERTKQWVIR